MSNTTPTKKKRLTSEQRKAIYAYNYALRQEDRYLGSVFVTPMGQREKEAATKTAADFARRVLGPELSLRYL